MRHLAVFLVLVLVSVSFATTRSECYAAVDSEAATLHAHNAAQNPSGSITTETYGCSGTCAGQYDSCVTQASETEANCRPDSNGYYTACIKAEYTADITCANKEIDCCVAAEKKSCDAQYAADDTTATPRNPGKENNCTKELGVYAKADSMTNGCYCPSDSTFLNTYIHQCVPNSVYNYCDERNAQYDEPTDSCVCKSGYVPGGNTCVESGTGSAGGQSLGQVPGSGSTNGGSNGEEGCSSAAILLALACATFAVRR